MSSSLNTPASIKGVIQLALQPMYPGQVNSPHTELASAIDDEQTTIPLLDASVLPDPPNLATIGTGEDAETILYTGVSGNDLTGVTRGFQGAAKAWNAGTKVARNFTAYDYDALRQNVEEVAGEVATVQGDVSAIQSDISDIRTDIGDMSTVPTTSKVVAGAISELFQFVSDGKSAIAAAITDKGVPTSPTDTFATMAANIGAIETGGPWFGDWGAYQTVYDWSGTTQNVPAGSWKTFVDVTGEGWLIFVRAFCQQTGDTTFRITVDSIQYVFNGVNSQARSGNLLTQPIYFSQNLKIEVFNSESSAMNVGCDYTYLLKNGIPDSSKQTILLSGQRNMGYHSTNSTILVDVINITGSGYLLGIEVSGLGSGTGGTVNVDLKINDANIMTDRALFAPSTTAVKQHFFNGPIRFTNSLRVQHRVTNPTGMTSYIRVFYALD